MLNLKASHTEYDMSAEVDVTYHAVFELPLSLVTLLHQLHQHLHQRLSLLVDHVL